MRIAQLGAGRIGAMHARILAELVDPDDLILADVNRDRGDRIASELGARSATVNEAIAEAEALVIAASSTAHTELIRAGIARRIPVFCEKPLAPDLPETRRLVEEIEGAGIHFGAKIVILDEPTSALGVKEAAVVLRFIAQAREKGIGVILITHNVNHAYPVGDRFTILDRGRSKGTFDKADLSPSDLLEHMGGGAELDELRHELEAVTGRPTDPPRPPAGSVDPHG